MIVFNYIYFNTNIYFYFGSSNQMFYLFGLELLRPIEIKCFVFNSWPNYKFLVYIFSNLAITLRNAIHKFFLEKQKVSQQVSESLVAQFQWDEASYRLHTQGNNKGKYWKILKSTYTPLKSMPEWHHLLRILHPQMTVYLSIEFMLRIIKKKFVKTVHK